jgi:polysaccharide deacetylase family protein (PEP-CTERM system associated)
MKNILTIDLEDWYHFLGHQAPPLAEWERCPATVERNVNRLLEAAEGLKLTFFSLGFMARRHPALIRDLAARGHEIACHGDVHQPAYAQGRERFRQDIRTAKATLEKLTGQPCLGYRAPGFSIRRPNLWALDEILAAGFTYDSSILPGIHNIGGIPSFYKYPQWLDLDGGSLLELPVSTIRLGAAGLAFCGGGFFRFFPESFMHRRIRRINRSGHPVVTYLHPRDIDPGQPRLRLDPYHHFLSYHGLRGAEEKFRRLAGAFAWGCGADFLADPACSGNLPHLRLDTRAAP